MLGSYLEGIETVKLTQRKFTVDFWLGSYLEGIETSKLYFFRSSLKRGWDRTLKGLKRTIPRRGVLPGYRWDRTLKGLKRRIPYRSGVVSDGWDRTLKGLKLALLRQRGFAKRRWDRTLKGLKQENGRETEERVEMVGIVP